MTDLVDELIYKPETEVNNNGDINTALRYLKSYQIEEFDHSKNDTVTETETKTNDSKWYKNKIVKSILVSLIFSVVLFTMVYFKIPSLIPFSKNILINTLGVTLISFIILTTTTFLIIR